MSEWAWVLIAVLVVVVLGVVVWSVSRRRRSARLKEHFGPEYERTVGELGEERAAEAELLDREKKRKKLDIMELTPQARQEHTATWQRVQTDFVDAPQDAVGRAERLVTRVMRERGYPIDDFDQRAADISVDHPDIVENYRSAHVIYLSGHNGDISTEDARQAFVHYRALFDRLLGSDQAADTRATDTHAGDPQRVDPQRVDTQRVDTQQVQNGDHRRQTHDHA
jgi:hypothetical protein